MILASGGHHFGFPDKAGCGHPTRRLDALGGFRAPAVGAASCYKRLAAEASLDLLPLLQSSATASRTVEDEGRACFIESRYSNQNGFLPLPDAPGDSYEVTAIIERTRGDDSFALVLPTAETAVALVIDLRNRGGPNVPGSELSQIDALTFGPDISTLRLCEEDSSLRPRNGNCACACWSAVDKSLSQFDWKAKK
jgi:hypothetical protein